MVALGLCLKVAIFGVLFNDSDSLSILVSSGVVE